MVLIDSRHNNNSNEFYDIAQTKLHFYFPRDVFYSSSSSLIKVGSFLIIRSRSAMPHWTPR